MDLEIRKFEESLVAHINHNKLPMEIKRLAIAEIYQKISIKSDEVVREQQQAELEEKKAKLQEKEGENNAESVQSDILGK